MVEQSTRVDETKNRRRFSRVGYKARATVTDRKGNKIQGELKNLSLKGAYICASGSIDVGTLVDVEIDVSSASSEMRLKLEGRVVRSSREGLGIEFEEMDIDSFIHLKTMVALNYGDFDRVEQEFYEFLKKRMQSRNKG